MSTSRAQAKGAPGVVHALNVLAAVWVVGGLAALSALWPETRSFEEPTGADMAPALIVAFIAGLAATVAAGAAAIVAHVAKRPDPEES
jgi:hypothetical protein